MLCTCAGDLGERHSVREGAGQPARQRVQPHRAAHARAAPQRAGRGARPVRARYSQTLYRINHSQLLLIM